MIIALADPPELPSGSRDVYLPIVGGPPPPPEPNPETLASAFFALLTSDKRQQRRSRNIIPTAKAGGFIPDATDKNQHQ